MAPRLAPRAALARRRRLLSGLSSRLVIGIIAVILVVEVTVYIPSASNFRMSWLADRLRIGIVAARVLDAVPDAMDLPRMLTDRLLKSAGALAIVYRREGQSQLIQQDGAELPHSVVTADLDHTDQIGQILATLDTLFAGNGRVLRIVGSEGGDEERMVEVLIPEAPLRSDLFTYSRNLGLVSLSLAALTAVVLYVLVARLLIRPIRRLGANMTSFRDAPENAALIVSPSQRADELGTLQNELGAMERQIFAMLRQRRHLADLGLAVAKINHDLRNSLASAQLLSDQVATLDDPQVQRLAPRLVQSIDRAVAFAQSVVDYGRQSTSPPQFAAIDLRALVEDAAFDALLIGHPAIEWNNTIPAGTEISVDAEQFQRVLVNLLRNARQALESHKTEDGVRKVEAGFERDARSGRVAIRDTGPGLPPRARENLFVAFDGSARSGGSGLGLAIARELVEAHGGQIRHVDLKPGTCFEIELPRERLIG